MKHLLLTVFLVIFGFASLVDDAEAKRFGGGGGFGMKRAPTPSSAPKQSANRPAQQSPAGKPPGRSWMGPLAGLAAGIGLAALFSSLGLSEDMAGFAMLLLLVGAGVFIFKMLRRRADTSGQGLQYAGAPVGGGRAAPYGGEALSSSSAASASGALAEFDAEAFVRQAKVNFIRLQNANDAGNLEDIRAFTTPEVFAEVSMQISERGGAPQQTDVIELNGEVVEVAEEGGQYVVSVRFSGVIREEKDAPPAPFEETWHLIKPVRGGEGWRVAGIQQSA